MLVTSHTSQEVRFSNCKKQQLIMCPVQKLKNQFHKCSSESRATETHAIVAPTGRCQQNQKSSENTKALRLAETEVENVCKNAIVSYLLLIHMTLACKHAKFVLKSRMSPQNVAGFSVFLRMSQKRGKPTCSSNGQFG